MTSASEPRILFDTLLSLERDAAHACAVAGKKLPFVYDRTTLQRFAATHRRHSDAIWRSANRICERERRNPTNVILITGRVAFASRRGTGAMLAALQDGERTIAQQLVRTCELVSSVQTKELLATCFLEVVLHQIWLEQRAQHFVAATNSVRT